MHAARHCSANRLLVACGRRLDARLLVYPANLLPGIYLSIYLSSYLAIYLAIYLSWSIDRPNLFDCLVLRLVQSGFKSIDKCIWIYLFIYLPSEPALPVLPPRKEEKTREWM